MDHLSLSTAKVSKFIMLLVLICCCCSIHPCFGGRSLSSLESEQQQTLLTYHQGPLLQGDILVSLLWYGKFTPAQRSIITDFLLSLTSKHAQPSVSQWWRTSEKYFEKAGNKQHSSRILLGDQVSDEECSVGKSLERDHIAELAGKVNAKAMLSGNGLTLVLTAHDVAVESFCMSSCGFHASYNKLPYMWVGNSETQCPGQCAWPFHQPIYGPQTPPLVAPNGDLGVDGMVINIATLLAATVTNPFGNGFFQGPATAPLEAVSACPGIYGKGAFPGYAGELLVDMNTGGSFNAYGSNGRKYLLPAMFDPSTSSCSTLL